MHEEHLENVELACKMKRVAKTDLYNYMNTLQTKSVRICSESFTAVVNQPEVQNT